MSRERFVRSLPGVLFVLCAELWSGCASHGGAPSNPADLSASTGDMAPGPRPDLADGGGAADLRSGNPFIWLKQLPSSSNVDLARKIAVDPSGNVFIACQFSAVTDFGDGPRTPAGNHDVALVKLTAAGSLVWVRQFGNPNEETVLRLVTDLDGNAILLGSFTDSIDLGAGPLTSHGRDDFYLAKYAGDGRLLWAKAIGSTDIEHTNAGLAVDGSGNVYLAGAYGMGVMNATLDLGGGPLRAAGYTDSFVAKLDPGGAHVFSKRFGSVGHDYLTSLALDASGDIVVGGSFWGAVDLGGGTLDPGGAGVTWAGVLRLDKAGAYKWAVGYYANGSRVTDLAVDENGAVAVTGGYVRMLQTRTTSLDAPDTRGRGFLLQIDAAGTEKWARAVATGSTADVGMALRVSNSRIYLGGQFEGTANFGAASRTAVGSSDAYLAAYSLSGAPQWVRTFGGPEEDFLEGFASSADALYAGGSFSASVDFGGTVLTSKGWIDGFVVKLPPTPPAIP